MRPVLLALATTDQMKAGKDGRIGSYVVAEVANHEGALPGRQVPGRTCVPVESTSLNFPHPEQNLSLTSSSTGPHLSHSILLSLFTTYTYDHNVYDSTFTSPRPAFPQTAHCLTLDTMQTEEPETDVELLQEDENKNEASTLAENPYELCFEEKTRGPDITTLSDWKGTQKDKSDRLIVRKPYAVRSCYLDFSIVTREVEFYHWNRQGTDQELHFVIDLPLLHATSTRVQIWPLHHPETGKVVGDVIRFVSVDPGNPRLDEKFDVEVAMMRARNEQAATGWGTAEEAIHNYNSLFLDRLNFYLRIVGRGVEYENTRGEALHAIQPVEWDSRPWESDFATR
ncbi:hypothetical protein M011DRAFT_462165 [Sporormia fimetaria CBS 119925]|uniref:Uncharacterized protein n=1 Tax=Sporormia fimetaria CBS 119925 TaxID=1340428 RepID=A0A6A6V0L7_9PLEO|nr:hypothetical protein M011DRAFT_462165 [Sporormia fimetaria CBS 119925]